MQGVFASIAREHAKDPIAAVFIQEHGITHEKRVEAYAEAKAYKLALFLAPRTNNAGGTAIVIPVDAVPKKGNQTYHSVLRGIRLSTKRYRDGSAVSIDVPYETGTLRLVSAYAPPDSRAQERPDYFKSLARLIDARTILGIDANCVPDETLDLKRVGTSRYNNTGADELVALTSAHSLADVARECLGTEPYFTSHHNVPGGTTHTRIDQIWAPTADGLTWEHSGHAHDIFGRPSNAQELDHEMV